MQDCRNFLWHNCPFFGMFSEGCNEKMFGWLLLVYHEANLSIFTPKQIKERILKEITHLNRFQLMTVQLNKRNEAKKD
jgi:hypothetical protein